MGGGGGFSEDFVFDFSEAEQVSLKGNKVVMAFQAIKLFQIPISLIDCLDSDIAGVINDLSNGWIAANKFADEVDLMIDETGMNLDRFKELLEETEAALELNNYIEFETDARVGLFNLAANKHGHGYNVIYECWRKSC